MLEDALSDDSASLVVNAPGLVQPESKISQPLQARPNLDPGRHDYFLTDRAGPWSANLALPPAAIADLAQDLLSLESSAPLKSAMSDLEMLRRMAALGEQQKHRSNSIRQQEVRVSVEFEQVGNFAAPLSPLRDRDVVALDDLFHQDTIYSIEVDISQMLLRLLPEPCWDEDPFEFLQEFLCQSGR